MIERPQSLTAVVLQELERQILSGNLGPGEPVNEKAFAERNSVSRGPIREACRKLEQAGLVTIIPNRGVFVRKLQAKDAIEICDIRAVLSGYAGRILAETVTRSQMADLAEMVERMEKDAKLRNVEGFYAINSAFHQAIFDFADNQRLREMYAAINKELYLFRWRAMLVSPDLEKSNREHQEILKALAERDAARTAMMMERHAISVKNRIVASGLGE
ncbi:GntR family transcriptional regulator [Shumkonia mesophila]|uniref:GntR family transcriptional regulator n=1 Tax=Shumkonia mesophila TaxID=2838854 RepID=UPI0029341E78|nr:FCD domain-containing protein [Shumkonia mesophila]